MAETKKGAVAVLKDFFGMKPGQTAMTFMQEVKELSEGDRAWMAREAAKQMWLSQSDVSFDMA